MLSVRPLLLLASCNGTSGATFHASSSSSSSLRSSCASLPRPLRRTFTAAGSSSSLRTLPSSRTTTTTTATAAAAAGSAKRPLRREVGVEQAVARLTALRTAGRRAARETSVGVAETPDLVGRTLVRSPEDAARLLYALGRLADHLRQQQPPPPSTQRPGDLRAGLEAVEAAHALAVRRVREAGVPMGLDHYHLCLRFHRRSPEHARHLLEDLLRDGVRPTAATFDMVVDIYGVGRPRAHWLSEAVQLFHRFIGMGVEGIANLSAFRRLIQFCHRAGDINQAFELHEGLRGLGLRADMDTYISLLALAHRCGDAERVKKLWTMITLAGIEPNTRLVNSFIANCNSPERALIAFNKMAEADLQPDVHTFAALTTTLARAGHVEDLRRVYHLMRSLGLGSPAIYTTLLWAHVGGSSANVWEAGRMWSDLVGSGLPITPSALSAMAHVHCSHSGARAALDFLATVRKGEGEGRGMAGSQDLYEELLGASASIEEAREVLHEMRALGYAPSSTTPFRRLAARLPSRLPVSERTQVLDLMQESGVGGDGEVYRWLILHGHPDDGMGLLNRMLHEGLQPDVRVYNALLLKTDGDEPKSAASSPPSRKSMHNIWHHGGRARAEALFRSMREGTVSTDRTYAYNPKLNAESFMILLRKCRRHREPDMAIALFDTLLTECRHIPRESGMYGLLLASLQPSVVSPASEAEAERYREHLGRVVAQMEADGVPLAGPHAASALVDSFVRHRGPPAAPASQSGTGGGKGSLFAELQERLGPNSRYLKTSLMHVYGTLADLPKLETLFAQMVEEGEVDLAAWSALVAGYVRNGRVEEALGVLYGMLEQHGQVPPVSLLGQVGRALEQDGRLVQPGALRPLFTGTFADIRRQVFRVARHRRLDRDAAFRQLAFNRFLYFHLTLLARRRRDGGPPSSPSAAARAPPPSFLPSLLSRIGIAGSGRGSSTATTGGGGGVERERRQERVDAQRTQLILGRMEDEDVYVSVPLQRLMASFISSSSPLGGPEGRF